MIRYVRIPKNDGPAARSTRRARRRTPSLWLSAACCAHCGATAGSSISSAFYAFIARQSASSEARSSAASPWAADLPAPVVGGSTSDGRSTSFTTALKLAGGFRTLNIVDDFTRECLAIEVDTSLCGRSRGSRSRCDRRGPRLSANHRDGQRHRTNKHRHGLLGARSRVRLHFIEPGKPTQNAFIESSMGSFGTNASTRTCSHPWPMPDSIIEDLAAGLQRISAA